MVKRISLRLLLVACLGVVVSWVFGLGPSVETEIAPSALTHQEGQRYVFDVPPSVLAGCSIAADSNADPAASTAVLYEDGVPVSLPHRTGQAIAQLGHGRLSHWGSGGAQDVYLSSSDGSDPRTNGRAYRIAFVALPPGWAAAIAALILIAVAARRAARSHAVVPAAIVLAACVSGIWIWVFAGSVMIALDSATYITFHRWVPLGYPVFVAAVSSLLGHAALPAVQLLVLGLATLYLASAVGRLTGSPFACAAAIVAVAAYAPMMRFAGAILSEALYCALLLVCAGAGLRLVQRFSRSASVTFALAAALAWNVRPAGAFLALVTVYLALLVRDARARSLVWLLTPLVAAGILVQVVEPHVRQASGGGQTGRILFAQVALHFEPASARPEHRADAARIAAALAPLQATFAALPTWSERHQFAVRSYPDRLSAVDGVLADEMARDPAAASRELVALTIDSIIARPGAIVRWVVEDVVWSWHTNVLTALALPSAVDLGWYADRPDERAALIKRFKLPLGEGDVTLTEGRVSTPAGRAVDLLRRTLDAVFGFRPLILSLGAVLLAAFVAAPFSASPTVRALGLLGALVHGATAMISATTAPIPRYVVPTDPLLLVAAVVALEGLRQSVRGRPASG